MTRQMTLLSCCTVASVQVFSLGHGGGRLLTWACHRPEAVVDFLRNHIDDKHGRGAGAQKDGQESWREDLKDRVRPDAVDHAQVHEPSQIGAARDENGAKAIFPLRRCVVAELGFKHRKERNGGMRQVIQPIWVVDGHRFRKNQVPVVEVQ